VAPQWLWHQVSTELMNMWTFADRVVKAVSDVTVGTVIVLLHVALADRSKTRKQLAHSTKN